MLIYDAFFIFAILFGFVAIVLLLLDISDRMSVRIRRKLKRNKKFMEWLGGRNG